MSTVEYYASMSPLRNINPIIKLLYSVTLLFLCVIFDNLVLSALTILFATVFTMTVGGAGIQFLRMLRIPVVFLVLSLIPIIIEISSESMGIISVPLFGGYVCITPKSLYLSIHIISRAFGAVCCLYMLILTTPINDFVWALTKLRCPSILSDLMVFIYRFIYILFDIAQRIQISQQSRLSDTSLKTKFRSMGLLVSSILIQSFQRVTSMYNAMESRLYDGTLKIPPGKYKNPKYSIIVSNCVLAVFITIGCIKL